MEKKFMNKLGDMELNMVAGGSTQDKIKKGWTKKNKTTSVFKEIKDGFKNFFKKFEPKLTPPTKCPL